MCELIRSLEAVEQVRPQWERLFARCERATPFQSPAWLVPWARHFAPDRLMAVAIREQGALVGFLPFFTWRNRLLLAGSGPTDYCDGLFLGDRSGTVVEALARLAAYAQEVGCECIDLQQLPPESPLVTARTPERWTSEVAAGTACPVTVVDLQSGEHHARVGDAPGRARGSGRVSLPARVRGL